MNKFIDSLDLRVASGAGAPGSVSFRREKYIPKGGPDGGDGGRGGDIVFQVKPSLISLSHLYSQKEIRAGRGENGMRRQRHGRDGDSVIIEVPPGTILKDSLGNIIKEFNKKDKPFVFLKGGKGGRGNVFFASATNQAPKHAGVGQFGEEADIKLEMKLIADIGLVGLPNVGKSTFLSVVTHAKPKIANYPFTTLTPHLGILKLDITTDLVIADVPGLIEGAHQGRGLGIDFLKHIERTSFLFFVIDINDEVPVHTFEKLNQELKSFSPIMSQKGFIIGLSKVETVNEKDIKEKVVQFSPSLQKKVIPFSSLAKQGIGEIKKQFYQVKKIVEK